MAARVVVGEVLGESLRVAAGGVDFVDDVGGVAVSSAVPAWWMARRAPAPASARAMARPISRRAPVTRAVRPVRRKAAKGSDMTGLS